MTRTRRRVAARIAAAAAVLLVGPVIGSFATPAGAAVPVAEALYGGYASGVAQYVNALDGTVLAEVAKANAATKSIPELPAVTNELNREVTPAQAGKNATANGTALLAELGGSPIELVAPATASSPPPTDLVRNNLLELPAEPIATATAVEGQAQARFSSAAECILGADIARGAGFAAEARVIPSDPVSGTLLRLEGDDPDRQVNQTTSRNRMVAQTDPAGQITGPNFGFMSEVRQTLAPVTITGIGTIEVLGEWVLQAVATGLPGGAFMRYGPGDVESPSTPVLSFLPEGDTITRILTLQDILGNEGLEIPLAPLVTVTVGEDPRGIGNLAADSAPAIAADGTSAAGAVDVVRIRVLPDDEAQPPTAGIDIRVGHMETTAQVPLGGVACPGLDVRKASSVDSAVEGDTFTYTITLNNPYDCTLTNVHIEDLIEAPSGINFSLGNASDGGAITGNKVVWDGLADIPPRGSKSVTIDVTLNSVNESGTMTDTATATADCAVGSATSDTTVLNLVGRVVLRLPDVARVGLRTALPETGGRQGMLAVGVAFVIAVAGAEYLRRRSRPEVNPKN